MLFCWRNHVPSAFAWPGASEEGGSTFRNTSSRTGKAFSVFLAEISLSTPLPVLLLPVRPVAEEMPNAKNTSADLERAQARRLLALCGINPSGCGGSVLQIQNKEIKESVTTCTRKLQLMEQGQCPRLLLPNWSPCLPLAGSPGPARRGHGPGLCGQPARGRVLLLALPLAFCRPFVVHIKPSNMLVYNISFYSTKAVLTW